MQVKSESATVGSNSFKYALALGGTGTATYRSVSFECNGQATVKITGRSSGSSSRKLVIADINGKELGSVTLGSTAELATATINYSGTVFIYSAGSGINLYKIQVDSKSSSSASTSQEATLINDGWYYIKNINSQKYVEVANANDSNGANVQQYEGNGNACQKWYVTNLGNNYITLKNGMSGGRMLDVANGDNSDGANIQIYAANNLDPQTFKVKEVASGKYAL
ncbi:MAG: RICIN domain-containing protein, partial [Firmicutes bacterium]|nr:RICIN domain-containing protein [Bacillota bacterium]